MNKQPLVSNTKDHVDKMKTEYANELGVQFNDNYKENETLDLNEPVRGPFGKLIPKKVVESFQKKLL